MIGMERSGKCEKLKRSRHYQNLVQVTGSLGEIVLFFSGFFLGKSMFITACVLVLMRILFKIIVSEFMYRRQKSIIREEIGR